jgi:hypothetical protein
MNVAHKLGWGLLGGLALVGCDLEPKDLGNESDDNGGSAEDSGSGESGSAEDSAESGSASMSTTADPTGIDPVCEDGDSMMQDCNTCTCYEGQWACTEIGCDPTEPPPSECEDGDTMMQDCNTCECLDGYWACTDIACQPGDGIAVCDDSAAHDPIDIQGIALAGDILHVDVGYGGGCAEHILSGCWDGAFAESAPVQVWAFVSHESNDDNCDAYISEAIEIDLSPMKADYQAGYQTQNGDIIIHLEGWASEILYEF